MVRTGSLLLAACLIVAGAAGAAGSLKQGGNWTRFGYTAARANSGPAKTGITAANVRKLQRQQVQLEGTVDSSPAYVRGADVGGAVHDVFVAQTTFGLVYAVDADRGDVLWRFTPDGYSSFAGTPQITTSSPALDPAGRFVYSASPDGKIHKLALATGEELHSGSWPATVTLDPAHEKLGTALNLSGKLLLVTTGGYPGDIPPYQGHVVALARDTGSLVNVWNGLCSDRHELMDPTSCRNFRDTYALSGAAIWARAGAVVQPKTGNLLVATGNGVFDGHTRWAMSVVMLSPDAGRLLKYWTPKNWDQLSSEDEDIGSTAPALLTANLIVQGGKDQKLRLLDLRRMHPPPNVGKSAVLGGAVQVLPAPGNQRVFSAPAVWRSKRQTWLFVGTTGGTAGYLLRKGRLVRRWEKPVPGTSPVVAGGLLYVYDWDGGRLNVYLPRSGRRVASLPVGRGHWNSPIVTDGRIALGQEDANAHVTFGVLNIYRLP
jgi:outer membrane protein assembly factor BamB